MLTPIQLVNDAKASISECDNQTISDAIENKKLLIDVREPSEYANGFITNAINIPRGLIEFSIFDHPQIKPKLKPNDISSTPIYLYCKSGGRSALAAQSLQSLGFKNVYSLKGGIQSWESAALVITNGNNNQS
ncbi:rhodanese-like domain-containing protein [Aliikangiella sp. IMCC44359]|uniref:rhodanese-like domain-containing protein n=1 Tax=Aliikangiella sp. IMCC44359 TaxID=3459125 RepID=UPI00403AC926